MMLHCSTNRLRCTPALRTIMPRKAVAGMIRPKVAVSVVGSALMVRSVCDRDN